MEAVEGRVPLASVSVNDAVVGEGNAGTVDAVHRHLNQAAPAGVGEDDRRLHGDDPADYQPPAAR